MGDKGFIQKNFNKMKDDMEAEKERAKQEAEEAEDGADEVPGGRKKRGGA